MESHDWSMKLKKDNREREMTTQHKDKNSKIHQIWVWYVSTLKLLLALFCFLLATFQIWQIKPLRVDAKDFSYSLMLEQSSAIILH